MAVVIESTQEERVAVLKTLKLLDETPHIKYMSQALIAEQSKIKPTKVRLILQDLINDVAIVQYLSDGERKVPRYYYVITDIGEKYMQESAT